MIKLIALLTLSNYQIRRIFRIWIQTIVPPAITTALYFLIFGQLIGRRIGEMPGYEGLSYIEFMVPGLIMLSVITNAYGNVASGFYGAKFQKALEEIIISPMPNWGSIAWIYFWWNSERFLSRSCCNFREYFFRRNNSR